MPSSSATSFARSIEKIPVRRELSDSYMSYALSVITSRAIPDIRDGLKPSQRRLLYAMLRMGIRDDTPHRKCARVVGETMGKYHPHGDSALYETLVKLGQDFIKNACLVDPQGNFGSLDDPPAASRYTECRLSSEAMAMLSGIDDNTMAFRPTYDGEGTEPICLPAKLPNLVINGVSGIAVAMATNVLPHNTSEVLGACVKILAKLDLSQGGSLTKNVLGVAADKLLKMTLEELESVKPANEIKLADLETTTSGMTAKQIASMIPGPDMPSGGIVINEDWEEIIKTGRGGVKVRAKHEIIDLSRSRKAIVITELPWQVGPEKVIAKIKSLIAAEELPSVTGVSNFSDRKSGLRLQIDCRAGADPERVLRQLYKSTPLETGFTANNLVLISGVPTTAPMLLMLERFLYHRLVVVVRQTHFSRCRDLARKEILEGYLKALDMIDEVVAIIKKSKDTDDARSGLMKKIGLTERQATAVLELRLRRLTSLEIEKITEELERLVEAIAVYDRLLGDDEEMRAAIATELSDTAKEFPLERRSAIGVFQPVADDIGTEEADLESEIEVVAEASQGPCVATLSANGYVGKMQASMPAKDNTRPHDVLTSRVSADADSWIWGITDTGRALPIKTGDLPDVQGSSRGGKPKEVWELAGGENVICLAEAGAHLLLVSAEGKAKQLTLPEGKASKGEPVEIFPEPLAFAVPCAETDDAFLVSSDGMVLRTAVKNFPAAKSLVAQPVAGLKVKAGETVVGAGCLAEEATLIGADVYGVGKAVPTSEFPQQGRGGQGVLFSPKGSGKISFCYLGDPSDALAATGSTTSAPMELMLEPAKRNIKPRKIADQISALGRRRWQ